MHGYRERQIDQSAQSQRDQQGRGDVTRLSASDASFYQLENSATPLYVGSLSILRQPRAGLSYETLLATVERQLPKVPRYRQKVREVTMRLARPVWVDDHDRPGQPHRDFADLLPVPRHLRQLPLDGGQQRLV